MRIEHVLPILSKRYMNPTTRKRPVFMRGPSGIGKSEVVFQTSEFLSQHVENWKGVVDMRLAQMDVTEARGIPYVNDTGNTVYAPPVFLPTDGAGILFLDELTSAPPAVQTLGYQLALTPQDFGIPPEWMIVAAGNHKSDRGVTYNIAAPLQNRLCDVSVNTTIDGFTFHAIQQNIRPEILAFLRDRADLLHKFDTTGDIKPFPTPRAWLAGVSPTLDLDLPPADRAELIKGDVGEEAAVLFEAHLRVWESMPRIDDILDGKDVDLPKELNVRYCIAMGLAVRLDANNFDKAWNFLQKMPGDIQTLTVKLAYKRDRTLTNSPAFVQWSVKNQAAFKRL